MNQNTIIMFKNLLLTVVLTTTTFFGFSQTTVEVVAYPTSMALVNAGTNTYGPAVGENPYVINFKNYPANHPIYSPTIPVSTLMAYASYQVDGAIKANGVTPNVNGTGNIGTAVGLNDKKPIAADGTAANNKVVNVVKNSDDSYNFTVIATRWVFNTAPAAGTAHASSFRWFTNAGTTPAVTQTTFTSVALETGSTTEYEVVGWTYDASATAETESNLLATGTALSNKDFSASKLEAYYNTSREAIIMNNSHEGNFEIYNLMGQSLLKGKLSSEISVSDLNAGLYILSTEKGHLKFVK